jgi:RNA recognition motif-containing protein
MESKLYVGNLPYSSTDLSLKELFSKAGTVVSASVIMDRETGRSKGFAFVEMSNQEEAEKAIQMFNGYTLDRRELRVSIARPKEERSSGGYGGNRGSYSGGNRSSGGGKKQYGGGSSSDRY